MVQLVVPEWCQILNKPLFPSPQITFKNEQTGEYQFYNVTYKVSAPGIIDTIRLTAPVRQSVSHTIPIFNPLSTSVTLNTQTPTAEITLLPSFTVPANSEGLFSFEYLPLKAGESTARIVFNSIDLGQYIYEVATLLQGALENQYHYQRSKSNCFSLTV